MAVMETVEVSLVGTTNIPETVDKAQASLRKLERGAKKTGSAIEKTTDKSGNLNKKLLATEKIAQGAGGKVGELAGRFKNLAEGLAGLGGAGGVLSIVGASLAATTVAFAGLSAAILGAVVAADGAAERLTEIGIASEKQAQAVIDANDALASMGVVLDQLVLAMGAEFAPAVERMATIMVAMGLAGVDAFNHLAGSVDVAREAFKLLIDTFVGPFGNAVALVLSGLREVAEYMGTYDGELDGAISAFDDLSGTILDATVPAVEALEFALGDYGEQARQHIHIVGEQRAATEELAPAAKTATDAIRDQAEAVEELTLAQKKAQEDVRATMKFDAAHVKVLEQKTEAAKVQGQAMLGLTDQFAAAAFDIYKNEKAAALASIAINTAKNAVSLAAPPPAGLGFPAGPAAAVALGAVQAAAVMSAPEPVAHTGGTLVEDIGGRALSGSQPGEVMVRAQVGETIRTREQEAALERGPTSVDATFAVGSRVFDAAIVRALRRGPLAKATKRKGRGQRRFSSGVTTRG